MEPSILYASPKPYPAVQVSAPNLTYAQMLSMPFASAKNGINDHYPVYLLQLGFRTGLGRFSSRVSKSGSGRNAPSASIGATDYRTGRQPHLPVISLQKTGLLEQRRPAIPGKQRKSPAYQHRR